MSKIDIKGLDKAEVLMALYENSHVQGLGFLQAVDNYTIEDAREDIKAHTYGDSIYFDYLHGRVLKVDLYGDEFDGWLYDRDCGEGAAQAAIEELRSGIKKPKMSKKLQVLCNGLKMFPFEEDKNLRAVMVESYIQSNGPIPNEFGDDVKKLLEGYKNEI